VDEDALRRALVLPYGPYAALDVVASTGSTNADLTAAATDGAADRTVLIAGRQTAGRGRRDRVWVSPPTGVYLSVLLRPAEVPAARVPTLAMVAGLALVHAARDAAGVPTALKWPNDLMIGDAKCAGVLSEAVPGGAVVGIGLNLGPLPEDVPPGAGGVAATSLAQAGGATDPTVVTAALLMSFAELEAAWRASGGDLDAAGLLADYRKHCATIGRQVRVELPAGELTGHATDVDGAGELLITAADGTRRAVSAGDVVHLRRVV
jgi:BirA family biotin operon repressor/biotin-[acetyl-CoA-carboxylase] ligase